MDMISDLPDHLLEIILLKLPFRDAASTSVLSTRWRYSWLKLPKLNLDSEFWGRIMNNQIQLDDTPKFVMVLSQIVLLHQGPIIYFTLEVPKLTSYQEIDTLISFIARKGSIKSLDLDMSFEKDYKFPNSVFTCSTLTTLRLSYCKINQLPTTFTGFSRLTTLELDRVTITAQVLERLISRCPLLEKLKITVLLDNPHIKIIAPKLLNLWFISFSYNDSQIQQVQDKESGMTNLLGGLHHLQELTLLTSSLQDLLVGGIPKRLPNLLEHLTKITLCRISSEHREQFSCILCLIRSCPNITTLHLQLVPNETLDMNIGENLEGEEEYSDVTINHLLEVDINSFSGSRLGLTLVKLLLAKSPSLRTMTIRLEISDEKRLIKTMKELMMFQRASSDVQVQII